MKNLLSMTLTIGVISLLGFAKVATADLLFSMNAISGEFATIDLTDGSRTTIANTTVNGIGAMTYDRGRDQLYLLDGAELLEMNRATGATSLVTTITGSTSGVSGLAYDSQSDELFAVAGGANNLLRIDRDTGVAQVVGAMGANMAEIAFDSTTNTLFGVDNSTDSLFTIDRISGVATQVGDLNVNGALSIAADPLTGELYSIDVGSVGGFSQLLSVNSTTGDTTPIGPPRSNFIAAIAFAPATVPEPSSLLFCVVSICVFSARRRRC